MTLIRLTFYCVFALVLVAEKLPTYKENEIIVSLQVIVMVTIYKEVNLIIVDLMACILVKPECRNTCMIKSTPSAIYW